MSWHSDKSDRGASLIEFAMIAPFLILLLLGIIEFGWVLGLNNDVRHGAREGARFAAVDSGDNLEIHEYACDAMEPLGGPGFSSLEMQLSQSGNDIGDTGTLTIVAGVSSLTGLGIIEMFLPSRLSSTIDFRLEQNASWTNDGGLISVTC